MKYVSTYLLLKLGGLAEPTKEDVTKVLTDIGVEVRPFIILPHSFARISDVI